MPKLRHARALAIAALVGIVIAATVAGCGGDSDDGAATTADTAAAAKSAATQELQLAIPTPGSVFLDYIAQSEGYFEDAGVEVAFTENTGANTASLLLSGQADIALYASGLPSVITSQGKPTSVIYASTGGGNGGAVLAKAGGDINTLDDLKRMASCRIGAFPAGSSSYGYAALYKQKFGLRCDIVPFQDPNSQVGALLSDRVDVIVGAYQNFSNTINSKKATLIVDVRDPAQRERFIGEPYVDTAYFGLTSRLQEKRKALAAYLKGLMRAADFLTTNDTAATVALLKSYEPFRAFTDADLTANVETYKDLLFQGSDDGRITEPQWDLVLDRLSLWGLPKYDQGAPGNAYGSAVDMSYYDAAAGTS